VVDLAPRRRPVAARPDTAPVAGQERPPGRRRRHPGRPAHVEDGRVRAEHHPGHRCVAAQPPGGLGRERPAQLQLGGRRAIPPLDRRQGGGDLEVGTLAAMLGQRPAVQGMGGQLHQGVGEAALPGTLVPLPGRSGERLQGGAQGGPALAVEEAAQEERAALGGR